MYFNSQFFPQFSAQGGVAGMMGGSGALASHGPANNSMQHSMNMLYMDSLQRQEHCSSGQSVRTKKLIILKTITPVSYSS